MSTEFIFIYVTCPSEEVAAELARTAVEERLAACANILPAMKSVYRWEGAIHNDAEVVLILKTRAELFSAVEKRIKDKHPYDNPCVVALPVLTGAPEYLSWLEAETK